jgi:hypothetical protein
MGQTVGRSSPRGEYVVDRPIRPQDVAATVYHHLGIDWRHASFTDGLNRPLAVIEHGEPIRELVRILPASMLAVYVAPAFLDKQTPRFTGR